MRLLETPFSKFLQYRVFEVVTPSGPQRVGVLNGPGHDCAAVAAVVLDSEARPLMVLKTGDARISRVMRGETYLKLGSVAGRLDKEGANAAKIALAELAEEVGGQVVADSFRPLGLWLTPSMPFESSESDANYFSLVQLTGTAQGDGGGMEVEGLIGPVFLNFLDGFAAMESGAVGDAGRAMTLYRRCADSMGYVPELQTWIFDHPRLLERFQTLGLGAPLDPRQAPRSPHIPDDFVPQGAAAQVDGAAWSRRLDHKLAEGSLVEGETIHTHRGGQQLGGEFANQLLSLDYDRAKIVDYFLDPQLGPLVRFTLGERPVLAVKGSLLHKEQRTGTWKENTALRRLDVLDVKFARGDGPPARGLEKLGEPCGASSGQCDLYYHFYARPHLDLPADAQDWIPLSKALEFCRTGQGDSQTEAALLRLARRLAWLPNLGMSVAQARSLTDRQPLK